MFEINDIVLYNQTDICRIEDIRTMPFLDRERINYYVLRPVYEENAGSQTLYVPVTADEARLHRAYSTAELREMLDSPEKTVHWNESPMIRKKEFNDILSRNDPAELIGLIRVVDARRAEKLNAGQKFSESDEKYLTAAEKRLFPLFRYILNVEWDVFLEMIVGRKNMEINAEA